MSDTMDGETKTLPHGPTVDAQKDLATHNMDMAQLNAKSAKAVSDMALRNNQVAARNLEITAKIVHMAKRNLEVAQGNAKKSEVQADKIMESIAEEAFTRAGELFVKAKETVGMASQAKSYPPDTESHLTDVVHDNLGFKPSKPAEGRPDFGFEGISKWDESAANDLTIFASMFGKVNDNIINDWVQVWKAMQDKGWRFTLRELKDRWNGEVYPKLAAARASAEAQMERVRKSQVDSVEEAIAKAKQDAHRIERELDSFPLDPIPRRDDSDDDGYRLPATTYNPLTDGQPSAKPTPQGVANQPSTRLAPKPVTSRAPSLFTVELPPISTMNRVSSGSLYRSRPFGSRSIRSRLERPYADLDRPRIRPRPDHRSNITGEDWPVMFDQSNIGHHYGPQTDPDMMGGINHSRLGDGPEEMPCAPFYGGGDETTDRTPGGMMSGISPLAGMQIPSVFDRDSSYFIRLGYGEHSRNTSMDANASNGSNTNTTEANNGDVEEDKNLERASELSEASSFGSCGSMASKKETTEEA